MSSKRAFHSGETPFFFFKMTKKWLRIRSFFFLVAFLAMAPVQHSLAANFDAQSVVDLINQDREARGIPALTTEKELSQAALEKANDMVVHNYFAHVSPTGVTPWEWIGQTGYDYSFAGENLAINFTDPQTQHQAFMNSASHKKNILNEKYQEIGVAVITGKINGKQTIITVQEFGTKSSALPAEKTVAGVTNSKTLAEKKFTALDNFRAIFLPDLNSTGKILTTMSARISPIPFVAFLYTSSMLLALVFFFHELFAAHFQLVSHFFSLLRKPKLWLPKKLSPVNFPPSDFSQNFSGFDKIYLAHMKWRK